VTTRIPFQDLDLGAPPGAATWSRRVVYQRTRSPVNTTPHITGPVTHGLSGVLQAMTHR